MPQRSGQQTQIDSQLSSERRAVKQHDDTSLRRSELRAISAVVNALHFCGVSKLLDLSTSVRNEPGSEVGAVYRGDVSRMTIKKKI